MTRIRRFLALFIISARLEFSKANRLRIAQLRTSSRASGNEKKKKKPKNEKKEKQKGEGGNYLARRFPRIVHFDGSTTSIRTKSVSRSSSTFLDDCEVERSRSIGKVGYRESLFLRGSFDPSRGSIHLSVKWKLPWIEKVSCDLLLDSLSFYIISPRFLYFFFTFFFCSVRTVARTLIRTVTMRKLTRTYHTCDI